MCDLGEGLAYIGIGLILFGMGASVISIVYHLYMSGRERGE